MTGIEILATHEIMLTQYNFVFNWATFFTYAFAFVLVIFSAWLFSEEDLSGIAGIIMAVLLIIIGTGIANIKGLEEVYDYTEYKVIIDDTVNMNDFMEKYEILDRDGKIYIVKEVVENE